jgi:hypothetical protein
VGQVKGAGEKDGIFGLCAAPRWPVEFPVGEDRGGADFGLSPGKGADQGRVVEHHRGVIPVGHHRRRLAHGGGPLGENPETRGRGEGSTSDECRKNHHKRKDIGFFEHDFLPGPNGLYLHWTQK